MKASYVIAVASIAAVALSGQAYATTVLSRTKLSATGDPAAEHNPACNADQHAKNIGDQIKAKALDLVGKGSAQLGLGNDPFNVRRVNKSVCADLCVVVPSGASFTAKGSIIAGQYDWSGELPAGLPQLVDPQNWAAVIGPSVDSTSKGDVVCYTFKNWSHNLDRNVGLQVDY